MYQSVGIVYFYSQLPKINSLRVFYENYENPTDGPFRIHCLSNTHPLIGG